MKSPLGCFGEVEDPSAFGRQLRLDRQPRPGFFLLAKQLQRQDPNVMLRSGASTTLRLLSTNCAQQKAR
jgi:hypothetical protein